MTALAPGAKSVSNPRGGTRAPGFYTRRSRHLKYGAPPPFPAEHSQLRLPLSQYQPYGLLGIRRG